MLLTCAWGLSVQELRAARSSYCDCAGLPLLRRRRQVSQVASAFEIDLGCLNNLSDRWHEAVMALDVVIRHTIGMTPGMITLEVCVLQNARSSRSAQALVPLFCRENALADH